MAGKDTDYSQFLYTAIGRVETAIYLVAAIFLVLMALISFFYVASDLYGIIAGTAGPDPVYSALNHLLVVLIIAELIQTIAVFIQRHELDLRLILAAGLTAMIRRVLLFGVENISPVEMAITALLIILIAAAIYLVGRQKVERPA